MTARVRRRPRAALFVASLVLTVIGAVLAYRALVLGIFEITTGPKGGPPAHVWSFPAADIVGFGVAGIVLALAGLVALLNACLKSRTERAWRFRVGLALALLATATILFLPPWRIRGPGIIASVYAFLLPALGGVLCRSVRALAVGVAAGVVLSIATGVWRDHGLGGIEGGVIALLLLGTHLAFLVNPEFRRRISEDIS